MLITRELNLFLGLWPHDSLSRLWLVMDGFYVAYLITAFWRDALERRGRGPVMTRMTGS